MLNNLSKTTSRKGKRLGRGLSSGKGKTSARGMKGQKARGKVPAGFIGGTLPLYKKLPLRRGAGGRGGHMRISQSNALALNIAKLSAFKSGETVNLETLVEKGLYKKSDLVKNGVKLVGNTKLDQKLTVDLPMSKSAKALIEKAGGTVLGD